MGLQDELKRQLQWANIAPLFDRIGDEAHWSSLPPSRSQKFHAFIVGQDLAASALSDVKMV